MLHIKNIEKYYGSKNNVTKALDRICFDVEDGEFIAIMGGFGKRQNHSAQLYFHH